MNNTREITLKEVNGRLNLLPYTVEELAKWLADNPQDPFSWAVTQLLAARAKQPEAIVESAVIVGNELRYKLQGQRFVNLPNYTAEI
jgi:hypothetical protein